MTIPKKRAGKITFYPIPDFGKKSPKFFGRHESHDVPRKYIDMANEIFFKGGVLPKMHDAVNIAKARNALVAWLSSYEPPHEAKMETAGYALWLYTHPTALDKYLGDT